MSGKTKNKTNFKNLPRKKMSLSKWLAEGQRILEATKEDKWYSPERWLSWGAENAEKLLKECVRLLRRARNAEIEAKELQQKIWDQSSKQMAWYKKHGYCHTGSHTLKSCPGDHGK